MLLYSASCSLHYSYLTTGHVWKLINGQMTTISIIFIRFFQRKCPICYSLNILNDFLAKDASHSCSNSWRQSVLLHPKRHTAWKKKKTSTNSRWATCHLSVLLLLTQQQRSLKKRDDLLPLASVRLQYTLRIFSSFNIIVGIVLLHRHEKVFCLSTAFVTFLLFNEFIFERACAFLVRSPVSVY